MYEWIIKKNWTIYENNNNNKYIYLCFYYSTTAPNIDVCDGLEIKKNKSRPVKKLY